MSDIRLNNAVIRGEINNSRKGSVKVKLWLIGESHPIELFLSGDCLRDLAGSHIEFEHRPIEAPEPLNTNLNDLREGLVGEITASSRLCMHRPNAVGGYHNPNLVNVLRLEFFCDVGRVLFESFDFSCHLVKHDWHMSEEEDFAQRASNFSAWQHHLIKHLDLPNKSDTQHLANLYDEIHQRFADSYQFEQYEAALMGWEGILGALADENESSSLILGFPEVTGIAPEDVAELQAFLIEDMEAEDSAPDEAWDKNKDPHPIIDTVEELIEDFEIQASSLIFPRGRHYQALLITLQNIEKGLKGLLNPSSVNTVPTNISLLGCREYLGQTMVCFHHFSKLLEITETIEGRRELLFLRDGLIDLREGISALRFQMNNL